MFTRKLKGIAIVYIMICCLMSACIHEDRDDCPATGRINVQADWSGIGSGITVPQVYDAYLTNMAGSEGRLYSISQGNGFLPDQTVGEYKIYVYNNADFITVTGTTAAVNAAGSQNSAGIISANPGWFFSYMQDILVKQDNATVVNAHMKQHVRELTVTFNLFENGTATLSSITASLDGVAGTLDFSTNTLGTSSVVKPVFVRTGNQLTASVYLLGILTNEIQTLTLNLTLSDGTQKIVEYPISDKLAGFNEQKETPMVWNADLTISSNLTVNVIISNWVEEGQVIIPQ